MATTTDAANSAATTAFARALLDGPTQLRGKDLLRYVMDIITADAAASAAAEDTTDAHWRQQSWFHIKQLPPHAITSSYDGFYYTNIVEPKDIATGCGTSACLAGHTVMLVGDLLEVGLDGDGVEQVGSRIFTVDGNYKEYIGSRAADLLDLDDADARILFDLNNSLKTLQEITDAIINDDDIMDCFSCGQWCPVDERAIPTDGPQVIMCASCREHHAAHSVNSSVNSSVNNSDNATTY